MRLLTITRSVLTLNFAWCIILGIYWSIITLIEPTIYNPLVLSLSLPLAAFSLAALLLVWLPEELDPIEWLIPILFAWVLFIVSKLLLFGCVMAASESSADDLVVVMDYPKHFFNCGLLSVALGLVGLFSLWFRDFHKVNQLYGILYIATVLACFSAAVDGWISPYRPLQEMLALLKQQIRVVDNAFAPRSLHRPCSLGVECSRSRYNIRPALLRKKFSKSS